MRADSRAHSLRAVLHHGLHAALTLGLLVVALAAPATAQLTNDVIAGQPIAGRVNAPAELDGWRFEGLAGSTFSARVQAKGKSNALRPTLALRDLSSGTEIDISAVLVGVGKRNVRIKPIELPATGRYELVIMGTKASVGDYRARMKLKIPSTLRRFNETVVVPADGSDVDVPFVALSGSTLTGRVKRVGKVPATATAQVVSLSSPLETGSIDAFVVVKKSSSNFKKVPLATLGAYTLTSSIGGNGGTINVRGKIRRPKAAKGVASETTTSSLLALTAFPATMEFTVLGSMRQISVAGSTPAAAFDLNGAAFGTLFESADELVATVDSAGVVTAVGDGETTINVINGPAITTVAVSVDAAPRLLSIAPRDAERNVVRSRDVVLTFSTPLDPATIDASSVSVTALGGQPLAATRHVSANGRRVTLFFVELLPASTPVTIELDGEVLRSSDGQSVALDPAAFTFTTTSNATVASTAVCFRVFESSIEGKPGAPVEGVSVAIEGTNTSGTTDALGNVRLEPVPAGRVVALLDGRDVGFGRAKLVVATVAGMERAADDIFLPRIPTDALVAVDEGAAVSATSSSELAALTTLIVSPNTLFDDGLVFGGDVGAVPTSRDQLPVPRPDALSFPFVTSTPTTSALSDGEVPTNFDQPVPVSLPAASDPFTAIDLAPGTRSALWRYDEDTASWTIDGPLVADASGTSLVSPTGTGLLAPGWFSAFDGALLNAELVLGKTSFDCTSPVAALIDIEVSDALTSALDAQGAALAPLPDCVDCLIAFDDRALIAHIPGALDPREILLALIADPSAFILSDTFDELATLGWRAPADPAAPNLGDLVDLTTADGTLTFAITAFDLDSSEGAAFTLTTVSIDGAIPATTGSRSFGFTRVANGVIEVFTRGAEARVDDIETRRDLLATSELWESFLDGVSARLAASFSALVVDRDADATISRGLPTCPAESTGAEPTAPMASWVRVETMRAEDDTPLALVEQTLTATFAAIALPGDASYAVSAYDPVTRRYGVIFGTTPTGGDRIDTTLALAFTDPLDSDGDGIGDVPEVIVGTDPMVFDTDGDGLGDGYEIETGSSPFDGLADETGIVASVATKGSAVDIDARNGLAAVADGTGGVALFNVFAGSSPIQVGNVADSNAVAVTLGNEFLAVAELPDIVRLFDITDPSTPVATAAITVPGTPKALAVAGKRVFVGTDTGDIVAIDAGAAVATTQVSESVNDLAVSGSHLFALGDATLFVLSLDGACLSELSTADASGTGATPFERRRLFVGGGLAYAAFEFGYATIDVSDPLTPSLIFAGSSPFAAWRDLSVDERGRGIAALAADVTALDASDPNSNGVVIDSFATPGSSTALTYWAGRVLVADGSGGVQLVADVAADGAGIAPTVSLDVEDVVSPNRLVALTASASDDVRVRDVQFFVDDELVATDGNFPFEHHVQLEPGQSISVTARAFDSGGASTVSAPFTVTASGEPSIDDPILAHDDDGNLYRVDIPTGCTTILGTSDVLLWDIASNARGEVFALGQLGTQLYRIDTSTFLATLVGPTNSTTLLNSLAFDAAGVLWAAGANDLVTLDTSTGLATSVTTLGGRQSAGDLAPALDGRLLLSTTDATLIAVDTTTFAIEQIAVLPTFEVYALARTPSGTLSAITASNQILTIDEATGVVTSGPLLSAADELSFTGGASIAPTP